VATKANTRHAHPPVTEPNQLASGRIPRLIQQQLEVGMKSLDRNDRREEIHWRPANVALVELRVRRPLQPQHRFDQGGAGGFRGATPARRWHDIAAVRHAPMRCIAAPMAPSRGGVIEIALASGVTVRVDAQVDGSALRQVLA
jgi:hypothetical protein